MSKNYVLHAFLICFFPLTVISSGYTGTEDVKKKNSKVIVEQKTIAQQIEEQCKTHDDGIVRLAYHEAAHLVLCIEYKRPVSKAVIYPEKLEAFEKKEMAEGEHICLGEVRHTLGTAHVDKLVMINSITIECAGNVAEELFFKGEPLYADDDMFRVDNWATYTLKRWDAQGKERKYSVDEKVDPGAVVELKNYCIQRAKTVLTSHQGLLIAFAGSLLASHFLDAIEVAKIVLGQS